MKKILFLLILLSTNTYAQDFENLDTVDLGAPNMINYIGVSTKNNFEKAVGKPMEYVGNEVSYGVFSDYEKVPIEIRCIYKLVGKDSILNAIRFPTQYQTGYALGFIMNKNYIGKTKTKYITYNAFDKPIVTQYSYENFVLEINNDKKVVREFYQEQKK